MVRWITLHVTARKCLRMVGRSKQSRKTQTVYFIFGTFWFDICLGAGNRHCGGPRGALVSMSGGHIWGTAEFKQAPEQWSGAGVRCRGCSSVSAPARLTASVFIDFSLSFSSTGIITWGTYWKFWHAQIWNRSPIFSSILKVSFFSSDCSRSWYWSHDYLTKALSAPNS